jgi:hypothetical protein
MTRPLRSDEAKARRLPLLLGDRARFAQRAQLLALIARQTVALTALILDCLDEVRSDSYDTPSSPRDLANPSARSNRTMRTPRQRNGRIRLAVILRLGHEYHSLRWAIRVGRLGVHERRGAPPGRWRAVHADFDLLGAVLIRGVADVLWLALRRLATRMSG